MTSKEIDVIVNALETVEDTLGVDLGLDFEDGDLEARDGL